MNRTTTGNRQQGVHEEMSVSSTGSAIIGGSLPHDTRGYADSSSRNNQRNMTVTRRTHNNHATAPKQASIASYGRGQFNVLDTSDQHAVDKAAAILASDDFLQAATLSMSNTTDKYGAPSELFTAPIRPNSPTNTTRIGLSQSMQPNHNVPNTQDDETVLWAARTKRSGNNGGMKRGNQRNTQSTPQLGSLNEQVRMNSANHAEKTDSDDMFSFGNAEAPLAVSKSLDGTWHQVGIVAAPYEKPATRREILALEHRYKAICEFARMAAKDSMPKSESKNGDTGGFADLLEQELMNTKQEMLHIFAPLTGASSFSQAAIEAAQAYTQAPPPENGIDQQRPALTAMIFEQKWTDMVLGELQEQIGVSCMEQGRLLLNLRKRYASAFNTIQRCHLDMTSRLGESRIQRERLGQTLVDTKAELSVFEEQALLDQEKAVQQAKDDMQVEMNKEKKKATDSKHQMERTQDTLRTLNGIFLQMQKDADGSRIADLRDAITTMERRLYDREKELTELRPMRAGYDDMTNKINIQEETILRLEKELQNSKDDVAQRDAMVADMMRKQGEALSRAEIAGNGGGGGGGAVASGGQQTTPMGQPLPESVTRVEGLVKDVDSLLGGTVKKRLPCAGYRLLLPNLMGYRPERPRRWTLRCMRSILRCKQLDDSKNERNQRLRTRFPDFVYSWFEPPLYVINSTSSEDRESLQADADEDRWALYYGVKALSRELPEARLFYNFLDEKYGEDELTFFLYCLRVLDAEAWRPGNGGIDWGENYWMNPSASLIKDAPMENNGDGDMDGGDGENNGEPTLPPFAPTPLQRINRIFKAQKEEGIEEDDEDDDDIRDANPHQFCPTVVFITQSAVKALVNTVMNRSGAGTNDTEEVKTALLRNLTRKTAPVEIGRLPESVAMVSKRELQARLQTLQAEVKTLKGEDEEDDNTKSGNTVEGGDGFDSISPEEEKKREDEKKLFSETKQCVEAGGLLRGLLQEYREEQAHRRAAIRLMFQTATNPGANGEDEEDDVTGTNKAPPPAAVDMQQFRSMCESLHSKVTFQEVVSLYRDAYELGGQDNSKGVVDFDSFTLASDKRQFFSQCLRLPLFVGAAERSSEQMEHENLRTKVQNLSRVLDGDEDDSGGEGGGETSITTTPANKNDSVSFTKDECVRVAASVATHFKLFETTVEEHYLAKWLSGDARIRVRSAMDAVREDIRTTCTGNNPDGRRALCSYRRLLDTLMFERMERLQQVGENRLPGQTQGGRLDRIDRELDSVETVLREFTVSTSVIKLRRVMRFLAVVRIQRAFRSYLFRSDGVPLRLRPMMAKEFTAPKKEDMTPKSETWLLLQLDMIYHEKLLMDARCDQKRLPRINFPEHMYDLYLYKYGVRPIAEKQLHILFYNVRRHCNTVSRARLFALQLGMGPELKLSIELKFKSGSDSSSKAARQAAEMVGATMTPEDWLETKFGSEFYLRLLTSLASASKANRGCLFPYARNEEGTGKSSLPTAQAVDVLTNSLSATHAGANIHFTENELVVIGSRINDMSTSSGGPPRCNIDDVLELMMCRWSTKMRDREVDLRKTFRAGDVDLDNVLSFDEFYEMAHGRDMRLPFVLDDDHITQLFRKASHLSDPADTIDANSFITILLHDKEIGEALARAPLRDDTVHTTAIAYNKAIENLEIQPMEWHPPGSDIGEKIDIAKIDNTQAVDDLQKQWEDIYSLKVPEIIDALEEVAVPVEEDDTKKSSGEDGNEKKSRSRTVTTADVKQLRIQLDKVTDAVNDAGTMMTKQSLATAWTSLRRLLARVNKAMAKAGMSGGW